MINLFAYGSLMCTDIMVDVSGCDLSHTVGVLNGYRRRVVRREQYPGLVPEDDNYVEGVVYWDVPPSAWDRLDRFEGEMYVRQHVEITLNDGTTLPADAYVVRSEYRDRLEDADWDFDEFLRNGKARFQWHYQGYRSLK
jgi:gamma-glutamylcyclotransferase (GGCT)/AIG2-like uncharacterized protein YtfP